MHDKRYDERQYYDVVNDCVKRVEYVKHLAEKIRHDVKKMSVYWKDECSEELISNLSTNTYKIKNDLEEPLVKLKLIYENASGEQRDMAEKSLADLPDDVLF